MNFLHSLRKIPYLRIFVVTIVLTIAAGGFLTNFLGRVAEKEFKEKVDREANLTAIFLHDNLGDVENAAMALAPSDAIVAAIDTGSPVDLARANKLLDRLNKSFEMSVCYLLDRNGVAVASSNRNETTGFVGKSFAFRPFFTGALAGRMTTYFALGLLTRERGYFAAAPVVNRSGTISGVVVIKRNVTPVGDFFRKYTHAFLVSPEGIIFISSKKELLYSSLWQVDEKRQSELQASRQFGDITFEPLLTEEPRSKTYVKFDNSEYYVQRLPIGHDGWTIILMEPPGIVANYRLFGILLTGAVVLLLLLFFIVLLNNFKSLEAAKDLFKARDDWERTFDAVPDLIAIIDTDCRISHMNRSMAERLGISQREAVGSHFFELLHGSKEPPISCPHQTMLVSGKTESASLFQKKLNGDFIVTAAPIKAEGGTIESSVLVMHDISELKQVEVYLRKTELRLSNAMSLAELFDWEYDVAGGFFVFNDRYYTLHGTTSEREGSNLMSVEAFARNFVRPDNVDNVGEEIAKALATTDPDYHSQLEVCILRRDGEVRQVSVHIAVTQNAAGRTIRIYGANQDITARKQMDVKFKKATAEAEEYAQRLGFVLEGSNDATWEWDMITSQGFLNTRYYEMIEYSPEEVDFDFAFFLKTIHPDDVSNVQSRLQDYLEGKTDQYEAHYRMVSKSGKLRNVMGRGKIVRYDEEGRPIRMAGLITDVSEMKRLSEEVNRISNLESIGLISGGLAHDFNNVLNIIYGNITFVKMLAEGNADFVEPLTDAEEACERAKELGLRLQSFSQGGTPFKEPVALSALIEDAAGNIFKGSPISHGISVADDLLPLEADPRQIRQLFENLLTNAKDAMPDGGTIKINIENCEVDANKGLSLRSGPYVRITIQDDGSGITEVNQPKIFDPYFSTKDTYSQRGMGLGLSICHAIMKRHNGQISVASTMEAGTTITLYLPASVEEKQLTPEG